MPQTDRSRERLQAELAALRRRAEKIERELGELSGAGPPLKYDSLNWRAIFDSVNDIVYIMAPDRTCLAFNQAFERITGWRREQWVGKSLTPLIHPEDLPKANERLGRFQERKDLVPVELRTRTAWGDYRVFEFVPTPLYSDGELEAILGIARDVTERKVYENRLAESHERLVTVLDSLEAFVYVSALETHKILFANKRLRDVLGEDPVGQLCWRVLQGKQEGPCHFCTNEQLLDAGGRPTAPVEWIFWNEKAGMWLAIKDRAIIWDGRPARLEIAFDITHMRETEAKFQLLVENAGEAILVTQDEEIKFLNPKASEISGFTADELTSRPFIEFVHPEDRSMVMDHYHRRIQGMDAPRNYSFRFFHKSGEVRWAEINTTAITWEGRPATLDFITDVTGRVLTEQRLKQSLREKEVLLREVHHRVKNNLQVVCSLLDLHALTIGDEELGRAFQVCRERVRTMTLVHEKLYKSESMAELDVREYISELVQAIRGFHSGIGPEVKLIQDIDSFTIHIDNAVPMGLIINELLSNSLKHAFPGRGSGKIRLRASIDEDGVVLLELSDDGVGLGEDFEAGRTGALGLSLVSILARNQLKGTFEIRPGNITRNEGACFLIRFKNR